MLLYIIWQSYFTFTLLQIDLHCFTQCPVECLEKQAEMFHFSASCLIDVTQNLKVLVMYHSLLLTLRMQNLKTWTAKTMSVHYPVWSFSNEYCMNMHHEIKAFLAASLLGCTWVEEEGRLSRDIVYIKTRPQNLFRQNGPIWQTRPDAIAVEKGWLYVNFNFAVLFITGLLKLQITSNLLITNVIRLDWNSCAFSSLLCLSNGRKELR